ncbi:hypothetical protein LUZ60_009470 [Juncus effusus]|nr:hypothetical protein LUZ60_009470 [Juncus effusus]
MGISLGLLSKFGVPGVSSLTTDKIYEKYFKDLERENFEEFHTAFIDLCKFLNDIMPGKHYDMPSKEEIKKFYEKWQKTDGDHKKQLFIDFMKDHTKESISDNKAVIMAGVVAPTAAVILKRTGDNIPQVKRFKLHLVPNCIFVPSCTLLALAGVRFVQINKMNKP